MRHELVTHPFLLRLVPVMAAIATALIAVATLAGIADLATGWMGQPELQGELHLLWVILVGGIGPGLIVVGAFSTRTSWPLLYYYDYDGETLESIDPILRRRIRVLLEDVERVRGFMVVGPPLDSAAIRGRVLEGGGESRAEVRLTEALPIWNEVLERCHRAAVDPVPTPWWLPRV